MFHAIQVIENQLGRGRTMGNKNKNKHICPSCKKPYQSKKDLDRHCLNYHKKSYEELKAIYDNQTMTLGDFMDTGDEEND